MHSFRLIIAVLGGLSLLLATEAQAAAPTAAATGTVRCAMDELIPQADRAEIEALALKAAGYLTTEDSEKLFGMLVEGRTAESLAFIQQMTTLITAAEPKQPRVQHSYMLRLNGDDPENGAICGDPTRPLTRVQVLLDDAESQAYVVVSIPTLNNDIGLVMSLRQGQPGWELVGMHLVIMGVSGRSTTDFAELGRSQARAGKTFNASMMFVAALATLDRGPNMTLLMKSGMEQEFAREQTPPELSGGLPFAWTLGGKSYLVRAVNVMGLEGSLTLQIQVVYSPWTNDEDVVRENRAFVEAFIKAHPEWREVFENIVLQAVSPAGVSPAGGPLYGTVYNRDTGFLADP